MSMDIKEVEFFKCHKKGHYANKCTDAKAKHGRRFFKIRLLKELSAEKKDEKSIR